MARVSVAVRSAIVSAAVFAAACVSKPPLSVQSFTIDPPPGSAAVDRNGAAIVSLARVRVAPPYAGTSFVYRTGGHRVEHDPYAIFAAPPGWMLTSALRGYLRNADFIYDVVEPGGELPVALAVEVEANELCAELPQSGEATAVLALQFRVYSPAAGTTPEKEILRKTYARMQPVPERTADAIADAWNRQLSEIATAFLTDLQPLLAPR